VAKSQGEGRTFNFTVCLPGVVYKFWGLPNDVDEYLRADGGCRPVVGATVSFPFNSASMRASMSALIGFGVNMGLGTAEVVVLVRRLGFVNEIEIILGNGRCCSWWESLCSPCFQAGTGANRLHTCDATSPTSRNGSRRADRLPMARPFPQRHSSLGKCEVYPLGSEVRIYLRCWATRPVTR
jgi:hypothetical protein